MRLSAYSDYALRTLMLAAAVAPGITTIARVAESFGIAESHVRKIVHELTRAGFLKSYRGRRGGFGLARPASEIRVAEVIRFTETDFALVECQPPRQGVCPLGRDCALERALARALAAFFAALDGVTLADLVPEPKAVLDRLGADAAAAIPAGPRPPAETTA
jgi:Rrf2 family nitric oxide-sensitive transcriptional repressor